MCCSSSARVSKTKGVETLVKDFPRTVHQRKGKVVYVNLTQPTKEWKEFIDFWVECDCDTWVRDLKARQPFLARERGTG
jgi:NAD-dependent SIR2 family protein deacetylase